MTRGRKLLFGLVTTFLLLGLVEGALRLVGFAYVPGEDVPLEARLHELTDTHIYAPDDELLWRLLPSRVIDVGERAYPPFRTNAHGLRGAEVPAEHPDDELRVLCLGDSVTFGFELRDGLTVPDVLEAELRADPPAGFATARVVNGGISNYTSVQGRRLLERLRPLDPDVVVFWFGMNDAKPAPNGPDSALRGRSVAAEGAWDALAWSRIAQLMAWLLRAPDDARRVPVDEFADIVASLRRIEEEGGPRMLFVRYPERMDVTIAQIEDVVAAARRAGVDRVRTPPVLTIPYAPHEEPVPHGTEIENDAEGKVLVIGGPAAATDSLPLADVEERLARARSWKAELDRRLDTLPADALTYDDLFTGRPRSLVFTDNCHLTPEGARAAAEALARAIRDTLAR